MSVCVLTLIFRNNPFIFHFHLIRLNDAKQKIKYIYTYKYILSPLFDIFNWKKETIYLSFSFHFASAIQISEINPSAIQMKPYYIYWNCHNINNRQHDAEWFWNYIYTDPGDINQMKRQSESERERKCHHKRTNGKSNAMWYALLNLISFCACVEYGDVCDFQFTFSVQHIHAHSLKCDISNLKCLFETIENYVRLCCGCIFSFAFFI